MLQPHFLYSYRRCPYAMRARMALVLGEVQCDVYEIDFKNKPADMLAISPKGTVPVLKMQDGRVIDESLDIVFWALDTRDSHGLLVCDVTKAKDLISQNDGPFKAALDRYKYPNRFPDEDCTQAVDEGLAFLKILEEALSCHQNLMGQAVSIADICIFPFVRQFANVDKEWFDQQNLPQVKAWLSSQLASDVFLHVMKKYKEPKYLLL